MPHYRTHAFLLIVAVGCAGLLSGCSNSDQQSQVKGAVSLDGQPLAHATVTLINDELGVGGSATVENGQFQFAAELPPGSYLIEIGPPPARAPHEAPLKTPAVKLPKYVQNAKTSGLTAELKPGENSLELDFAAKK
ncbi:MAG: carboxypeptidase-like regulatory domain-containing protein [Blastopirellula sp. JB062]